MKRLLLLALVLLLHAPVAAAAQNAHLLTPHGTLYTIEQVATERGRGLLLNMQGQVTAAVPVPTTETGLHWNADLAYDAATNTLFVFWLHSRTSTILASSELRFVSYQNGRWSQPTSIDDAPYHMRSNVRLGVTHRYEVVDGAGQSTTASGLTVHMVWWDDSGIGELAKYAMFSVDHGNVSGVTVHELREFTRPGGAEAALGAEQNEILRHPTVIETVENDAVDVVFGNTGTASMHRVRIKPRSQGGRIRVPVGVREARMGAPRQRISNSTTTSIDVVGSANRVAYFTRGAESIDYLLYEGNQWTRHSLRLSNAVSSEAAVQALRQMVSRE